MVTVLRGHISAVVVIVALALVAASCGDDDSASRPTSSSGTGSSSTSTSSTSSTSSSTTDVSLACPSAPQAIPDQLDEINILISDTLIPDWQLTRHDSGYTVNRCWHDWNSDVEFPRYVRQGLLSVHAAFDAA